MYRNQFRSDRFNDNAATTRKPGRGSGTHHWVVSGGRGSTAPAARPPSPYRSGRTGSVQQQYRPRSPAAALTRGNAVSHTPPESTAPPPGYTEPVGKASFGSLDDVKPSNVPAQSDVLSSVSDHGTCWAADSSTPTIPTKASDKITSLLNSDDTYMFGPGYSSTAFTLQFGTFSPEAVDKQCTTCTSSAFTDLSGIKHEKAHHGLSEKPNNISLSPHKEQRKHETIDNLVIGGRTDLTHICNNVSVPEPELHETRVRKPLTSPSKVCIEPVKVLPSTPSSPTDQQCQNQDQEEREDTVDANRPDTAHKYQPKITVQIPASYTPNMAPPSFMHPVPGRPLHVAFQQKQNQIPEFRRPGLQMQTIGSVASSLPVKMAIPLSSAPHMKPLFVHGAQPRALHQQTFIHQGQSFGYAPPSNLPQFGNTRMAQEFSQQQSRSRDANQRTIKITHPETHEEVMLDKRGHSYIGIPALHSTNQVHQPVQAFPPLQEVYYPRPGTYNSAPIYHSNTNSVPLATRQLSSRMQPPMHRFDSPNSNLPIASIKTPIPSTWLAASSMPLRNLNSASEVSSLKGLPSLSAPVQIELKSTISFPADENELSSETSTRVSGEEIRITTYSSEYSGSSQKSDSKIVLEISPEQGKLVSESNPKVQVATSDTSYNLISQAVSTQQAQTEQASEGHVTQIEGPQNILTSSNLPLDSTARYTPSVNAKPIDMEEFSMIPTSFRAKCESSHSKASNGIQIVILNAKSFVSTTDGMSPANRNSKYDSSSILGKPPLICIQEMLRTKSKMNGSVPQEDQDFIIEERVENDKAMCFKSKTGATTPVASCGLEDEADVAISVRLPAHYESVYSNPSISTDDLQTSSENKQPPSDAQNTVEFARYVKNVAIVSNSVISQKKTGQENIDSEISNPSSTVAVPSVVQTKRSIWKSTKVKSICGQRKRQKEILPKTSGQRYSDRDYASSTLNEIETFNKSEDVQSSCTLDEKNCTLGAEKEISTVGHDILNKTDLIDWEYGADYSAEKLVSFGCMYSNRGPEVNKDNDDLDHKKYSRDFLLTFAQSCIHLPAGFKIGFDISQTIISANVGPPFIVNSELNPTHRRIKDGGSATSQVNSHMAGRSDNYKWRKQFSMQNHPLSQYSGEMLSKAMKEVASQRSISHSIADKRWLHRTSAQSMSSPSQVSTPRMHKAEKKYEIGKISDEEETKQRQLKAILNKLTPQNFEKLFLQVKGLNIDNVATLNGVISQIFDKALMEPTFCEMYASFCFRLAGDLPNFVKDDEKITFKRLLLNKCQEEFERGEREQDEADKSAGGGMKQSEGVRNDKQIRARRRMLGNIRLIGELYKKKMLTERIMHECIHKLLGEYQNPDEEDLEALCKLMSTIGDMIDHPRAKVHMDFYFDLMRKLSENCKLSSRMRFMLEDVIDLRKNKWRQRRKVEGPKKIEEVRRDAVKQKLGLSTKFGSSRSKSLVIGISPGTKAGPPSDNSIHEYSALTSQVRTYGSQNVSLDARYQRSNRALPGPLHQRHADKSIHLGPQDDMGREISLFGKPPVSNENFPQVPLNSHHGQTLHNSRDGSFTRLSRNRRDFKVNTDARTSHHWGATDHGSSALSTVSQAHTSSMVSASVCTEAHTFPEDVLQEKSILTIKEFYSAKDEKEVALCMKELNAPSFYPSLVSLWINDSFERKDLERELLAKLLVDLCKSQENLLNQKQLLQGFECVLTTLEDAVTDAPKATEFLGRIFAKFILEDVISLAEIGGLLQESNGREESSGHHPLNDSLASEVLRSMLESIKVERGDCCGRNP